jgi:signal transduction histidine kinase
MDVRQFSVRMLESRDPVRPFPVIGWLVVVTAGVLLFWSSVPVFVAVYGLNLGVAFALATLQCVTLPLSVRMPRTALLLHLVSLVIIGQVTRGSTDEFWPVPVPNLLALTVMLVVMGLREPWYVSVVAWWLSFLSMTVTVLINGGAYLDGFREWGEDVLISITATLLALAVALLVGQRRRLREVIAVAHRDMELEQARRSTVEERARIARELHDVVAHSMSVVHIQAESARFRVHDLDAARREFGQIALSARAALGEMRQLLGALRPVAGDVYYGPQPTIADIPALVESTERAGSRVTFTSDVAPEAGTSLVQLTAYRIVQEALSNVVRHASHAAVTVELRGGPTAIVVRIANAAPPGTGRAVLSPPETSSGHGLLGMRERVALLDGEIIQQPLGNGGFLVEATLPTRTRQEAS